MQIMGERGPFRKSTVKAGLKSVLDTKTRNWDMWNQTALAYIKYHPPAYLVRCNRLEVDEWENWSNNVR